VTINLDNLTNVELFVQAALAVFMIVNPVDPVKIVIFNDVVRRQGLDRRASAFKVATITFGILGVMALVGRELLDLLGINLGAFGVVGGLVVALMGFEMLYAGTSSRTQGSREAAEQVESGDTEEDGLVMPLAVPLMAGPGAITTVVTMSAATNDGRTLVAALVAVAIISILVFVSFAYLGDVIARMNPSATAMMARIGGILLATIGTQLLLGGIRTFYFE
jgi:multiple antibiotic resistance protein